MLQRRAHMRVCVYESVCLLFVCAEINDEGPALNLNPKPKP